VCLLPGCPGPGLQGPPPLPVQRFAEAQPAPARPDRERLLEAVPELRQRLKDWFAQGQAPGLAFGVVTPEGRLWSLGLGLAGLEDGEPVTGHTLFAIGSLTKTFTGLTALALRDRGLLDLDEPLERWVPELGRVLYPTRDSPRITLRHLVTHTSGLPRVGRLEYTDPARPPGEAELFAALDGQRLEAAPGTRTSYSNLGMAVAGVALARAGGKPLRELLREQVLEPLELGETTFDPEDRPDRSLARGYAPRDGTFEAQAPWAMGAAEGMGGLWSSLEDMTRFAAFQLRAWPPRDEPDPGPVARASVRESHLPAGPTRPDGQLFGVNWVTLSHPEQGWVVTHAGGTATHAAVVWLLPERGLGVVLLANAGGELPQRLTGLAQVLTALLLDRLPAPAADLGPDLTGALARVQALLADPDAATDAALEALLHPSFRKAIPDERLRKLLREVHDQAGACPEARPLRALGEHAAVIRLGCERGQIDLTLHLEADPPHRATGLGLGPVGSR